MRLTRREALAAAGSVTLAGCGNIVASNDDGEVTVPDGPVATAPVPSSPGDHEYATMGDADAVATYVGNWKCPFCAQFATEGFGDLVEEFVAPGDVAVRYRSLAITADGSYFLGEDAARAARFGLAVWAVDPQNYWRFHETVMANQPPEDESWATVDRLAEFATAAGVADVDAVRSQVTSGAHRSVVERTGTYADERGVRGTPAFVVDGETYNPLTDTDALRDALSSLA